MMLKIIIKIGEYIYILIYAVILKLLHSLASPIFARNTFQVDSCTFYTIGRGILKGKVLYKDLIDNKMPYAFFINAIANIVSYRHIGLYAMEVIALFFSLLFVYKLLVMILQNKHCAFVGMAIFSLLLNNAFMNMGMSKLECYEIPFFVAVIYFVYKHIVFENEKRINMKKAIELGIIAGVCCMINAKAFFTLFPLYAVVIINYIINKKYIYGLKFLYEIIIGAAIAIFPYIIYMICTKSINDAIYAIFYLPFEYISNEGSLFYNTKNIFESAYIYISYHKVFFIFVVISLAIVIFFEKNKYIKCTYIFSLMFTFWYTIKPNNPFTYYLMMFLPYLIPIYVFVIKILSILIKKSRRKNELEINDNIKSTNIKLKISEKTKKIITTLCIVGLFFMNFPLGYNDISKQYPAIVHIYDMIKNSVQKKYVDISDKKVLAVGYIPEVYVALDVVPKFPYFIVMCNSYVGAKRFVDKQVEYVENAEPDIIVTNTKDSFLSFTEELKQKTINLLNENYEKLDTLDTHTTSGVYEVYIKK